jgi:hypothetical protein
MVRETKPIWIELAETEGRSRVTHVLMWATSQVVQ